MAICDGFKANAAHAAAESLIAVPTEKRRIPLPSGEMICAMRKFCFLEAVLKDHDHPGSPAPTWREDALTSRHVGAGLPNFSNTRNF